MSVMTAKEISALLAARSQTVAQMLLPNGFKKGSEWVVGDVLGTPGTSLKVCLIGSNVGLWSDFATNQGGDLLDLWSLVKNITIAEAIIEAKGFLNIRNTPAQNTIRMLNMKPSQPKVFKSPDVTKLQDLELNSMPMKYLVHVRKLDPNVISHYRVMQTGVDLVFPYYSPEQRLQFVKYLKLDRGDGKKQMWVEKDCKPILFGWQAIPNTCREITLCEGEIDALSLAQYGRPALSIPLGAGLGSKYEWITDEFENLSHYDTIFICMDSDDAGKKCANAIAERLGFYRCPIVTLPFKDANDCLQHGIGKEVIDYCFANARTKDPKELKNAYEYHSQVLEKFNPTSPINAGYVPLWANSKDKIAFRPNELSIWTGINGHGKSQFLGQIVLQMLTQGAKVCIASMELKPDSLLARLCRQATGLREPSNEYITAVFDKFKSNLWLFELVGTANSETLLEVFLYARQRYGVDVFIIDSFLKLDIAEDDYKAQKAFIVKLVDFKNEHDCQIHLVVHPRKSADEFNMPNKLDNKGTGAVTDLADNCFTIWRDKAKEILLEKYNAGHQLTEKELTKLQFSDCLWRCDKQRHGEWEGVLRFWFDKESLQYRDVEHQKIRPLIPWSKFDNDSNTHG